MTDWVEGLAGDKTDKYQRAALVLRVLAWTCIVWAAMISIWIWMGLRAGSDLWLWSTVGLFVGGLICLGVAAYLQSRAAKRVEVPRADRNDRIRAA
jgi:hypothetical protein